MRGSPCASIADCDVGAGLPAKTCLYTLRHSSGSRIIPATDGRCVHFPVDPAISGALMQPSACRGPIPSHAGHRKNGVPGVLTRAWLPRPIVPPSRVAPAAIEGRNYSDLPSVARQFRQAWP